MKILMLTEYFYPFDRGGSEWSVADLAQKLSKKGLYIEIFTPNYGALTRDVFRGIPVYRFPFYLKLGTTYAVPTPIHFTNIFWWIWTIIMLFLVCAKNRPDILHIQGKYFLPAGIFVGKLLKIPTVITIRDYLILCPYAFCISRERNYKRCSFREVHGKEVHIYLAQYIKRTPLSYLFTMLAALNGWFTSSVLRFFLTHADAKIAISQKLREIYQKNGLKINQIIYNTFTPTAPAPHPHSKKGSLVFVGRLSPGKGITQLVDAYNELATRPNIPKLEIIGEGPLRSKLESYSRPSISFMGHLTYQETIKRIEMAELVVVPSVWEEPFGRVALEAIMMGVPVVASDRGALPEIINKKTGVIVQPTIKGISQGILKALHTKLVLRQNIMKILPQIHQKFSYKPVKQYISLYKSL